MPFYYFALGTTLANMANLETTLSGEPPPHVLEGGRIPLLGPVVRRTLGQAVQRNGAIDAPIRFDTMRWSSLNTLITTYFTNYLTAYAALYASWLAEDGYYYPFSVTLERPYEGEHYRLVDGVNVREIAIPGYDWTRQINTENATATLTTSERYTESNTSGGAVDLTLPAASAIQADTIFSLKKTGGGNALRWLRAGSDTINGATSLTVTGQSQIISNGVNAWTSI